VKSGTRTAAGRPWSARHQAEGLRKGDAAIGGFIDPQEMLILTVETEQTGRRGVRWPLRRFL
jgi:hypothetical protein